MKYKKILIMGLPGSGKSYLSNLLAPMLKAVWLNADQVRKDANDWDFSPDGRKGDLSVYYTTNLKAKNILNWKPKNDINLMVKDLCKFINNLYAK